MILDPEARAKLAKVLGMLGSDHPGERAAAGAAADRFIKKAGLTWEGLLAATATAQHRTASPPPDTDWRPSKPRDGCPGSWRRRDGTILTVRRCRLPSKSWYASFDARMVFDPQGCNFFDSEEAARDAAERWENRYDASSRE